jgi:uncharacterized protein
MNYEELIQSGLRYVVKLALETIAMNGLQGGQSIFLSFKTDFPGVQIPEHLKIEYEDRMTISLEEQFSDFIIAEEGFSVVLNFGTKWDAIFVPFKALYSFMDPINKFGLELMPPSEENISPHDEKNVGIVDQEKPNRTKKKRLSEDNEKKDLKKPFVSKEEKPVGRKKTSKANSGTKTDQEDKDLGKVISLDHFRKR